eukprot:15353482-Ditylum_brightwellii.AAC.1
MVMIIISQCTNLMISKLESDLNWNKIKESSDVIQLSTTIKDITYKYKSQSYPVKKVHTALHSFYLLYQNDDVLLEKYMESFLNTTDVVRHSDGNIREHPKLQNYILKFEGNENSVIVATISKAMKSSIKAYLVYAFIAGTNYKKYVTLLEDLSNTYYVSIQCKGNDIGNPVGV